MSQSQTDIPGRTFRYVAGMDAHDVPRNVAYGTLAVRPHIGGTGRDVITLDHVPGGDTKRIGRDVYLVDDGSTVRVFYVAAWRLGSDAGPDSVILHPVTPGAWHPGTFGTRRMVHMTLTEVTPA
jgi:hypothetical protein